MEKIVLDGVSLYTSGDLRSKLKNSINKIGSPKSKSILIQLIDDGVIIPVINEPSKLKLFLMKIRKKSPIDLYGFAENGKCYVIFAPEYSAKDTVDTALHEVIHIAHRQNMKEFNKVNMPIFVKFYSYFYKEVFEATKYDVKKFALFLNKLIVGEFYGNYLRDSFKDYTILPLDRVNARINIISDYYEGAYNAKPPVSISLLLKKTYRKLFKNMDYQIRVGQEIWNPAEIISVLSTINPEHPNVIKSLKLIQPGKKPEIKSFSKKIIK